MTPYDSPTSDVIAPPRTPLASVTDLCIELSSEPILSDVSFEVVPGEMIGIIGPNGAGKSTLIRAICGQIKPVSGRIDLFGAPASDCKATRARIGYAPQKPALFEKLTAKENMTMFARLAGVPKASAQEIIQTLFSALKLELVANQQVRRLSGGMQQRVSIGMALLNEPELVILDEPMASLDTDGAVLVENLLREKVRGGASALMVTHDLARAEVICDRVALVADGGLQFFGPPDDLIAAACSSRVSVLLEFAEPCDAEILKNLDFETDDRRRWRGDVANYAEALSLVGSYDALEEGAPLISTEIKRPGLSDVVDSYARRASP